LLINQLKQTKILKSVIQKSVAHLSLPVLVHLSAPQLYVSDVVGYDRQITIIAVINSISYIQLK